MNENVIIGTANLGQGYTGDRNLYYTPNTTRLLTYGGTTYTSLATFYAATGQDQHSVSGNPNPLTWHPPTIPGY